MGNAVTMTDKDVLAIIMIGRTVTGSLELLLVTLQEQRAAALCHIFAVAVEVRPVNLTATPYGDAVIAL